MSTSSTASTASTETLATALPAEGTGDLAVAAAVRLQADKRYANAFGVTTTAYANGDVVDTKLTATACGILNDGGGAIIGATLQLNQAVPSGAGFLLHIFKDDPSASTLTDNTALAVDAGDAQTKWVGTITLSNVISLGTSVQLFVSGPISIPFICGSGHDDLWCVLQISTLAAIVTFATGEIDLFLMIEQDR